MWNVQTFETSKTKPSLSSQEIELRSDHNYSDSKITNKNEINLSRERVLFAPYSDNEELWKLASSLKNTSLCLNLYTRGGHKNSYFMNVTVSDVEKREYFIKEKQADKTSQDLNPKLNEKQRNQLNNAVAYEKRQNQLNNVIGKIVNNRGGEIAAVLFILAGIAGLRIAEMPYLDQLWKLLQQFRK